jgi:hypothetical protein
MKILRTLVMSGVVVLPAIASAGQPVGCATAVPAAPVATAQAPAAYRSYSYQPAATVNSGYGYRNYNYGYGSSMNRHAYENAANKTLGRVD